MCHIRDRGCVHANAFTVHTVHLQQSDLRERSSAGSCGVYPRSVSAISLISLHFLFLHPSSYLYSPDPSLSFMHCSIQSALFRFNPLYYSSLPSLSPPYTFTPPPYFLSLSHSGIFATRVPDLRPSIIELLQKSLADEDDEVRLSRRLRSITSSIQCNSTYCSYYSSSSIFLSTLS